MESQPSQADHDLHNGVSQDQSPPPDPTLAYQPGAQGHATHENTQNQRLGISSMAKRQSQIVGPNGLVDEAGEAGRDKQGQKQPLQTQSACRHTEPLLHGIQTGL